MKCPGQHHRSHSSSALIVTASATVRSRLEAPDPLNPFEHVRHTVGVSGPRAIRAVSEALA